MGWLLGSLRKGVNRGELSFFFLSFFKSTEREELGEFKKARIYFGLWLAISAKGRAVWFFIFGKRILEGVEGTKERRFGFCHLGHLVCDP